MILGRNSFSRFIRAATGDRTALEMATLLGVKLGTYQNWVQGRRTPHRIVVEAVMRKLKGKP